MAEELQVDLAEAVGASEEPAQQVLTLYIPDKDKDGKVHGKQSDWAQRGAELLARVGGGVTRLPPAEAGWMNPETSEIIWENTILVYTYVRAETFVPLLEEFRGFLHAFGRETNQGEVVFEFGDRYYRIREYDKP